ncbi:MAG: hypothetical protein JSS14_22070 [Proteobacteria bacterium]|nr:hypothetical protein [Pseudomonadota bacterium]
MQAELELDGHCCGPLFAPIVKVRPNPRLRMSGGAEVWIKYRRARPAWANRSALRAFWERSREMTAATGIQHSVDHIVPLIHPHVCGLHVEDNLRIIPLADNIRKSNNTWPDMWAPQEELPW